MATWIVHLRIAENLLELIPKLDAASFSVGNIAPDSGIPDEKWEKFNPPGEVTHFIVKPGHHRVCADLVFYRQYLDAQSQPAGEPLRRAFLLGYYCHLVTDNLWSLRIGQPTQQRYKELFEADRNFIWEVKKDWYGLDFEYVRSHPDCLYWRVFLQCVYPINYVDFLPQEAIQRNLKYIQEYYQRNDAHVEERLNRKRVYLTMPEVDAFVEEATQKLNNAYRYLDSQPVLKLEQLSILEAISA